MRNNSCIVITGAAGFIGSCMVQYLNEQGFENLILVDDFGVETKRKNWEDGISRSNRKSGGWYGKKKQDHITRRKTDHCLPRSRSCSGQLDAQQYRSLVENIHHPKREITGCSLVPARREKHPISISFS